MNIFYELYKIYYYLANPNAKDLSFVKDHRSYIYRHLQNVEALDIEIQKELSKRFLWPGRRKQLEYWLKLLKSREEVG